MGVCCAVLQILTLISDHKMQFSAPVFRPDLLYPYPFSDLVFRQKLCYHYLLTLNLHISLSFLLIWYWNDKDVHTLLLFPQKPYPIPDQNGQSVYPCSDKNGTKTIPDGVAHTYIAYTREYPLGRNSNPWGLC